MEPVSSENQAASSDAVREEALCGDCGNCQCDCDPDYPYDEEDEPEPYQFNYRFIVFCTVYYAFFSSLWNEPHVKRIFLFFIFITFGEFCGLVWEFLKRNFK